MTSHNSRLRQTRQDTSLKRKPFLKNHPWHPTHSYTTKLWSKSKYSAKKARSQTDSNLGPSGYEPNSASPNLHTMRLRQTHDWIQGVQHPAWTELLFNQTIFLANFRLSFPRNIFPDFNTVRDWMFCTYLFSLLDVPLSKMAWPSGLRRWLKAPFRQGVGSNPTAVTFPRVLGRRHWKKKKTCHFSYSKGCLPSSQVLELLPATKWSFVFFLHSGTKWSKHGHTGLWTQGLRHAKRMWCHYTMCPYRCCFPLHEYRSLHDDELSATSTELQPVEGSQKFGSWIAVCCRPRH